MTALALALALAPGLLGCSVHAPPGWPEGGRMAFPEQITATPWKMYGFAPLSWTLPDGHKARVELESSPVRRGGHFEFAFRVRLEGRRSASLRCQTPAPNGAATPWFSCTGEGSEGHALHFELGPGQHGCSLDVGDYRRTLGTPGCWRGQLTRGDQIFHLHHGQIRRTNMAVNYVSWTDAHGPVLAANLVVDQQIRLAPLPAADGTERSPPLDLLLATIALHWFGHAPDHD